MSHTDTEAILDLAIAREQQAHDLYVGLAQRVARPALQEALREMALEELGHRRKLEAIRSGDLAGFSTEDAEDLAIAKWVTEVEPHEEMNYRELLAFAVKAEAEAQALYLRLAEAAEAPALRETFLGLAREEGIHKRKFETEYEDLVFGKD